MSKKILMIAGPNGAGKTTVALELIGNQELFYEFINADEIAKGLSPLHPEKMALTASKLMLNRLNELLKENKNLAFETTAAGKNYLKHLKIAKLKGYEVSLIYLWLASPSQAIERVMQRVRQGGHHIPKETIIRRYYSGLKNLFHLYLPLTESMLFIDNSTEDLVKRVIARKNSTGHLEIFDMSIWEKMQRIADER